MVNERNDMWHESGVDLTASLLGNTHGATKAAGGLCVLSTDTETPMMTETTMTANLLHSF